MGEREKHLRHMGSEPTELTWPLTRWTLSFFPLRVEETDTQGCAQLTQGHMARRILSRI